MILEQVVCLAVFSSLLRLGEDKMAAKEGEPEVQGWFFGDPSFFLGNIKS